jgi:hypothetical protein
MTIKVGVDRHMNRWHIAAILVAALLLVGGAGAVKPEKGPVDRVVFVHDKDANTKPTGPVGSPTIFKLWGMKWNSQAFPVTFTVYPDNPYVRDSRAVTGSVTAAFFAWDDETSTELFVSAEAGSEPAGRYNGRNDVYFAPIDDPGIIAVTEVWYYQGSKEIVEADITMNSNLRWGIDTDGEGPETLVGAFDIRNIATHEVGHVCGLTDLYKTVTRELTMYGFGSEGEVRKVSLEDGDVAGLQRLYGA